MTAIEAVVSMMITGLLLASIGGMVSLSISVFGADKKISDPPQRVVQRELARSSERMLVVDKCESPDSATKHSACLELAEVPFPTPLGTLEQQGQNSVANGSPPDWHKGKNHDHVICWMTESGEDRPVSSFPNNQDSRDLECWYHIPDEGVVLAAAYRPSSTANTKDDFKPDWTDEPYSVVRVATGVERLGYCTTTEHGLPVSHHDTKTPCEAVTGNEWQQPWECVAGIDTDPESAVAAQSGVPTYQPQACSDLAAASSIQYGAAVLTLRMCVSMSDAELERRTQAERWGSSTVVGNDTPVTCKGRGVTVTPGRRS